ncbi:hypothetical protein ACFQAQ_06830 [Novosphingobium resinovorum]|uniref:hypothetical protein n=1 Tax=Novosphingobium resinovorum TaxID=158500 RepID=UPI00360C30A7
MVAAPVSPAADWARRLGIALFEKPRDLLAAAVESVDYVFSISNLSVLPGGGTGARIAGGDQFP